MMNITNGTWKIKINKTVKWFNRTQDLSAEITQACHDYERPWKWISERERDAYSPQDTCPVFVPQYQWNLSSQRKMRHPRKQNRGEIKYGPFGVIYTHKAKCRGIQWFKIDILSFWLNSGCMRNWVFETGCVRMRNKINVNEKSSK